MGKKKYRVGGLHWLLDYPEVIGVPTCEYYGEFKVPLIAPSFLELDSEEIVIRTWNRKKIYGIVPYDQIVGISAGTFTKSSNLYLRNSTLDAGENNEGVLPPQADVEKLLGQGHVDEIRSDVESHVNTLRMVYRDRAGKYLRILICCDSDRDNPADYVGFAKLVQDRMKNETAKPTPSKTSTLPTSVGNSSQATLPSLTDVARWADAYGYLLVPKDGTQQG